MNCSIWFGTMDIERSIVHIKGSQVQAQVPFHPLGNIGDDSVVSLGDNCIQNFHLRRYIAEYTVANFWRYPIRCRVTNASALESFFVIAPNACVGFVFGLCLVL